MLLEFTKMQGLGNDFIVIDNLQNRIALEPHQIKHLADRRFGIGFDQLLMVQAPSDAAVEFDYRIFNADGSEVEHCGNGARCFARYVRDKGLTQSTEIAVKTRGGNIVLQVNPDDSVTVRMGIPEFKPERIPFSAESESSSYTLELDDEVLQIGALAIGNPHAVTIVPDVQTIDIERLGKQVESHPRFPRRVNAGFMQIVSPEHIRLRVFERGVGETLACGTGACAAVVSGIVQGYLQHRVKASLPGGDLDIEWQGPGHTVLMTGPCESVFEGSVKL
ncbi:MAG: diaminopimelate epimerase [Gammaproteobacteria bacterium]|nr:diaminopimelate epimerase [Gammaproteobacteria bacterium]